MSFGAAPSRDGFGATLARFLWPLCGWPSYLRRLQWRAIFALLDIRPGMRVADIGAGPMQMSAELAKRAQAEIFAVDMALPSHAEDFARRFGIQPVAADARHLPFPSGHFDRVLMSSLIQMVSEPEKLLSEARRVLKPGGHLVLSAPDRYRFIPRLIRSRLFRAALGVPSSMETLEALLDERFHVHGPQGYYARDEIEALLARGRFAVAVHARAPGVVGSLIWELGVLFYLRFGAWVLHLLFLFYPLALVCNKLFPASKASEHVIKAVPLHDA